MKFEVKKIDGSILFEADIECLHDDSYGVKLGLAIHWGYKNNKSLKYGDYRNSIFKYLTFDGSTFDGATFDGATFYGSTFNRATFYGATFYGATFYGATFYGATFYGATFYGATFYGATFDEKTLRNFKHDFWGVLIRYKNEVPALIEHIKNGKINGSCYSGECCCLMGTFAKIKNLNIEDNQFSIKDASSPAEQWFTMIKPGDTPENNYASKMALKWIEEFLMFDEGNNVQHR